jgi:Amt family ammonium transporter
MRFKKIIIGWGNTMGALSCRTAGLAAPIGLATIFSFATIVSLATPAFAETSTINTADTAWMIVATALVLMMTIPGLALFYSGMVRKKNVLATMAQSLAAVTIISILWVAFGYSLAFVGDGPWLGTLDRWFLTGMTMDGVNPAAKTIPEALFMLYQMTFAIITVALVAGSVADRMRFSAYLLFSIGWFMFVTFRSRIGFGAAAFSAPWACWILPAALWCISAPGSAAWSRPK